MADYHHHHHNHFHNHQKNMSLKPLTYAFVFNLIYLFIEVVGGLLTQSLALLSDAGHMLTDVFALGIAIYAGYLATKPKSSQKTYGYLRAEILGAFLNGVLLLVISGSILYTAFHRLINPVPVHPEGLIVVAFIGLLVNVVSAVFLYKQQKHNLNIRGAFVHLISDALGSVGALVSGVIIYFKDLYYADSIISLVIALLIFASAYNIIKESSNILLESVPSNIDYDEVRESLLALQYVEDVHDLHIWTLGSGAVMLSAHVCLKDEFKTIAFWEECLVESEEILLSTFNIEHSTLQVEPFSYKDNHTVECQKD